MYQQCWTISLLNAPNSAVNRRVLAAYCLLAVADFPRQRLCNEFSTGMSWINRTECMPAFSWMNSWISNLGREMLQPVQCISCFESYSKCLSLTFACHCAQVLAWKQSSTHFLLGYLLESRTAIRTYVLWLVLERNTWRGKNNLESLFFAWMHDTDAWSETINFRWTRPMECTITTTENPLYKFALTT